MIIYLRPESLTYNETNQQKMNNLKLKNGTTHNQAPAQTVLDHLSKINRKTITSSPQKLRISNKETTDPSELFLLIKNGTTTRYPLRESFLKKLMRWYQLSEHVTNKLKPDTIVAVGNDFLSNIKSSIVKIKIEDEDALTILSSKYSDFTDKELLELCQDKLKTDKVSRDDFVMRIYSTEKVKARPVPGDDCGFGFNIFNSETGFMAIHVTHYILRYICSNGATAPANKHSMQLYHYNQTREKIIEHIMESIRNIEETRETIIFKLAELKNREALETLGTVKMQLGSIIGLAEATALITEFTNYTKPGNTSPEYSNNLYSLFNFITHSAKTRKLIERIRMEELAGKLIMN